MKLFNKSTFLISSNGKWLTVDMSKLKYKELDGLEAIFRLWRSDDGFTCDMENAWNSRVEQLLQQRAQNKVSDTSSEQEKAVREAKFISFRVRFTATTIVV